MMTLWWFIVVFFVVFSDLFYIYIYWKFPYDPSCPLDGWSVSLSQFPKGAESYTSLLLSECFFSLFLYTIYTIEIHKNMQRFLCSYFHKYKGAYAEFFRGGGG